MRLRLVTFTAQLLLWTSPVVATSQPRALLVNNSRAKPLELGLELARPISLAATTDGGFYLADLGNPSISRHARSGKLVWQVKVKGAGPGDVLQPYRIATTPTDGVLVYDLAQRDFSEFSKSGKFIRRLSFDVSFQIVDFVVTRSDGKIIVVGYSRDRRASKSAIHVFDAQGRWSRSFGALPQVADAGELRYLGAGMIDVRPNGNLIFTRKGPYEIAEFDGDGNLVRTLSTPRRIGAVGDSLVEITSNERGTERVRLRTNEITLPLRTIALGDSEYLSMVLDRGRTIVAEHARDGRVIGREVPTTISIMYFDHRECRLIGLRSDDEGPQVVEIDVPPNQSLYNTPSNRKEAHPCR